MTEPVEIQLASIRRAWRATAAEEFWIELRSKDKTLDRFNQVITAVNDEGDDTSVYAGFASRSQKGYVALVDNVLGTDQLERWLALFAARLAAAGFTGTLRGATSTSWPDWIFTWDPDDPTRVRTTFEIDRWIRVRPTAFVACLEDRDDEGDERPDWAWRVSESNTAAIADAALAWTRQGGDLTQLRRDLFRVTVDDEVALRLGLVDSITVQVGAGVFRCSEADQTAREVAFEGSNLSVFQARHDPRPRSLQVEELRDLVVDLAERSRMAFVRPSAQNLSWISLDQVQPLPNGLTGSDVYFRRHLLDRYTPDANGIQVLTARHLERAKNLDDWTITDLGNDRLLVEASDLAPWYDGDSPDLDVLASARDDFGPLLLTPEAIAAEPLPQHG